MTAPRPILAKQAGHLKRGLRTILALTTIIIRLGRPLPRYLLDPGHSAGEVILIHYENNYKRRVASEIVEIEKLKNYHSCEIWTKCIKNVRFETFSMLCQYFDFHVCISILSHRQLFERGP